MIFSFTKKKFLYLSIVILLSFTCGTALGVSTNSIEGLTGEVIEFGTYEQDNIFENGPEPIEWIVLTVEGEKALVVSKYGLEMKVYNESPYSKPWGRVVWASSDIRSWLNGEFYNFSFSELEKTRIIRSEVINGYTKYSFVDGGDNTEDYIFLLSVEEAEKYFCNNHERVCFLTPYCKAEGAWAEYDGACWWWLRSPGEPIEYATHVFVDGDIHIYGNRLSISGGVVRPALWLKIYEDNANTDSESFGSDIPILLETDLNEEIIESPAEPNITEKPDAIPTNEPVHDFAQEPMPESRDTIIIHKTTIITVAALVIIICVLSLIIVFIYRKKKK